MPPAPTARSARPETSPAPRWPPRAAVPRSLPFSRVGVPPRDVPTWDTDSTFPRPIGGRGCCVPRPREPGGRPGPPTRPPPWLPSSRFLQTPPRAVLARHFAPFRASRIKYRFPPPLDARRRTPGVSSLPSTLQQLSRPRDLARRWLDVV